MKNAYLRIHAHKTKAEEIIQKINDFNNKSRIFSALKVDIKPYWKDKRLFEAVITITVSEKVSKKYWTDFFESICNISNNQDDGMFLEISHYNSVGTILSNRDELSCFLNIPNDIIII